MDVRAILLLGSASDANPPDSFGGVPIAALDLLGRPLWRRVAGRLQQHGISTIAVIGPVLPRLPHGGSQGVQWISASDATRWGVAERVFSAYAQTGADLVIVIHLGPYTELDYDRLVQSHLDHNERVTVATDGADELLGTFVISASRRNDAAFLLRHGLQESRTPLARYPFSGYSNRLADVADLRRLAVDGFCGRAQIAPAGEEIRPGVWLGAGARIQRGARLVAPAFIGAHARVGRAAVVTRCSALEHHSEVDCGTVVEDATVLPYTTLGAGLDIAHAVVGFGRVASLRRRVEVEVDDTKLVGSLSSAPWRVLRQAAALAGYLPANFVRGLLGRSQRSQVVLPAGMQSPSLDAESMPDVRGTALTHFR